MNLLSVAARKLLQSGTAQLVEVLEFTFRGESEPSFFFCNFPEPIQWPSPGGNIYQPLGYQRDPIHQSIGQGYDPVRVQVTNVNETFFQILVRRELNGARVTLRKLFRELLTDDEAQIVQYEGVVTSPSLDEKSFIFNCVSLLAAYDVDVPKGQAGAFCFTGSTLLRTPEGVIPIEEADAGTVLLSPTGGIQEVIAKMERDYFGPIVSVCAGGVQMDGTPSHPILTESGWRPLGELRVGDDLIQNSFEVGQAPRSEASDEEADHREAVLSLEKEIATAILGLSPQILMAPAVDFQNNSPVNEEVNQVRTERDFALELNADLAEPRNDPRFINAGLPKAALLDCLCPLLERSPLIRRYPHLAMECRELIARIPDLHSELSYQRTNGRWVDAELRAEILRRYSATNVVVSEKPSKIGDSFLGLDLSDSFSGDTPNVNQFHHSSDVDPGEFCDLGDGLAFFSVDPEQKFLDVAHAILSALTVGTVRVEEIDSTHGQSLKVFDIQTETGTFTIVGNNTQSAIGMRGIVVHNCRFRWGEAACGIDETASEHNHFGEVMDTQNSIWVFEDNSVPLNPMAGLTVTSPQESFSGNAYWRAGSVKFLSGKNEGVERSVARIRFSNRPEPGSIYEDTLDHNNTQIKLHASLPYPPEPGDRYRLRRGCLKTAKDCEKRYNNLSNWGGLPFQPKSTSVK